MRERGLLVEAGEPGYYRLSPVLTGSVAGPGDSDALRDRVARWLEDHARTEEALECHAEGSAEAARSFVSRAAPTLIRSGTGQLPPRHRPQATASMTMTVQDNHDLPIGAGSVN